jgi:hypothetical protein
MIGAREASFVDEHDRTLLRRAVNLGGSNKVPRSPDGVTHLADGLDDHRHRVVARISRAVNRPNTARPGGLPPRRFCFPGAFRGPGGAVS